MLREIGLARVLLIILTVVVVVVALSQTTAFGPLAGHVGVTANTALSWGQNTEPMGESTEAPDESVGEATPEAEATDEADE